jgi:hypothetical protein
MTMGRQFRHFALIGTLGFLVDSTVLQAALNIGKLDPYSGRLVSFLVAVTFTWAMNRYFAFRPSQERPVERGDLTAAWKNSGWTPRGREAFGFWVLVTGFIYVFFSLSPSSYALSFHDMSLEPVGLLVGEARALRSDEWAVWTPNFQIAVNNEFLRYNETSPYREDLRNFNALPLLDWGLVFKPQFWGFFIFDPAWAYSLYHAIVIAAFFIGWEQLLRRLGFAPVTAVLATCLVFLFPYTQLWWTTTGSLLAGFPWVLLCVLWRTAAWKRVIILGWLSAVWLISHLYPSLIIVLAFTGAVMLTAFLPRYAFRPSVIVPGILGSVLGVVIMLSYLYEPLLVMSETVYPGQRHFPGGLMPVWQWLSNFFPNLMSNGRETLFTDRNLLDGASSGSYLLLLCIIFLDWGKIRLPRKSPDLADAGTSWALTVLATGFGLISIWLLLPIPIEVGKFLLWDRVHHPRFVVGMGLLSMLLGLVLISRFSFVINLCRIGLLAIFVISIWYMSRSHNGSEITVSHREILAFIGMVLVLVLSWSWSKIRPGVGVLAATTAAGLFVYIGYNPLQSAFPIFHRPVSPLESFYTDKEAEHPEGFLIIGGHAGAILNGWGYRAIQHVQIAPNLTFFRTYFSELSEKQFDSIFNRYAHIHLDYINKAENPTLDIIRLPISAFRPEDDHWGGVVLIASQPLDRLKIAGHVDEVRWDPVLSNLIVKGWAMMDGGDPDSRIKLYIPGAVHVHRAYVQARKDVVHAVGNDHRLMRSGFVATIKLDASTEPPSSVCVWSEDKSFGRFLLGGYTAEAGCLK